MEVSIMVLLVGICVSQIIIGFLMGKLRSEMIETKEISSQTRVSVTEIHGDVFRRAKTRTRRKPLPIPGA